jgi:hypothetical protein
LGELEVEEDGGGSTCMIELANALRAEVERASVRFRTWSEADATRAKDAGKWSKKEILGHLIDSAANNHQRFVRAQLTGPFIGPGYDQQGWVSVHAYRQRPWQELVELWVALNRHVAVVIESVPDEKLKTPCTIGEDAPVSLEWLMQDYIRHLKHHLEQIEGS